MSVDLSVAGQRCMGNLWTLLLSFAVNLELLQKIKSKKIKIKKIKSI